MLPEVYQKHLLLPPLPNLAWLCHVGDAADATVASPSENSFL